MHTAPHPTAVLGLDFETERFASGYMAPRPVCMSLVAGPSAPALVPTPEARDTFVRCLAAQQVWHNAPYDLCCALAWWGCTRDVIDALEADLIGDTWVIQRLAIIGGLAPWTDLSLDVMYAAHGLGELPKDPAIRLSYGPLLNRPLAEYTPEQITYAANDATAVCNVYARQHTRWLDRGLIYWADVCSLTRKRVWLEACRAWGLRTDARKLDDLRRSVEQHLGTLRAQAQVPAFLADEPEPPPGTNLDPYRLVRANGTGNKFRQQALVAEVYLTPKSLPLPRSPLRERVAAAVSLVPPQVLTTEPRRPKDAPPRAKPWHPAIKTARNVLEESGDDRLVAFAEYGSWSSLEGTLPHYTAGAYEPIHTKWGMADSTRVTSSKPQIQNLGTDNGIRECFVPRPGYCFLSADHGGLENATLAQFGIWYLHDSSFADFLNSGKDLHTLVGARIFGCSYAEAVKLKEAKDKAFTLARDAAKPIDFGAPGGAGWRRLKVSAKQLQGLDWTEAQAKSYRQAWVDAVPVGAKMHDWVGQQAQADGRYTVPIPGTTIVRRNVTFCSACNNSFQSLGAVVEAHVGWVLFKERLLVPDSPLVRCALVNYVHDEFIFEVPIGLQTAAGERVAIIMHEAPKAIMPDVDLWSKPEAMAYWSKQARRIVLNGELRVWPLVCVHCRATHDTPKPCACGCSEYLTDWEAHGQQATG
jgi:hypothetical protein